MNFLQAIIKSKRKILDDTFIFHIQIVTHSFDFIPGQYVFLKNPLYQPLETHPFSITSSPSEKDFLEFCIKVYGDWTEKFSQLAIGTVIEISEPQGSFVWDTKTKQAVFLLGGIGISPIMSILRNLAEVKKKPSSITLLYGNRTPETIVYKDDLEKLTEKLPLRLVHIFSHISDTHPWKGYRGFITSEIIKQEVELAIKPTFYIVGPPIFIDKMKTILSNLSIETSQIKEELLENRITYQDLTDSK